MNSSHGDSPAICLNCDQPLPTAYCAHCGQKADTHRYSMKHFIEHDLVHGVWHVDKGLLFTLKALFTRPGHSIRAFIEGRRKGYFNFITLLLILMGVAHFLGGFSSFSIADIFPEKTKAMMSMVEQFATKYPKLVMFFNIPVTALFSFLWFYKSRLNGTEHLVLNIYKAGGEMAIGLPLSIMLIFCKDKQALYMIYSVIGILTTCYGIWFHYQYFSVFGYKKWSLLLRCIMIPVCVSLVYMIVGIVFAMISYRAK